MAEIPESRRRYPRIASHHTVLVKKLGGEEELEEFAQTTNLAVGGCSFITDEPLGDNAALELLIAVDQQVLRARGRVAFERPADDGRTEVGVEFVWLDPQGAELIERVFERPVTRE
ncbi:MAG TPA: PilZ domain-containing protein [Thermoanaerobaculia bacterium]|nr:PilZ domain-containing protein [Thermoanaerobaculia bacterium]